MPTTTNTDGLFRDVSPYCASCVPSSGRYHMVFQSHCDWTTAIVFCIDCLYPSSTVSNLFRTLLRDSSSESVGQSSSRTRSSAYTGYAFLQESISFKLAVMTYRAIHGTHRIYISAVMFHSSCRHDVKTTAVILSLSVTGSTARSSHYCRQEGFPSFWSCSIMEQFTTSRHICSVTRDLQAASQDISIHKIIS